MNDVQVSPLVICPTEVDGLYVKKHVLFVINDKGDHIRLGEHVVSVFKYCDETEADDHVIHMSPDDFSPRRTAIKYLYKEGVQ